ncbi:uncharacterized protein LOC143123540 [Alosa pseudoharengus]|uniref:uncharacterized protein LOC143123540 n=1 Tax=Alosa pseudoharengus TaxID=34774 RepID=UPI003F8AD199
MPRVPSCPGHLTANSASQHVTSFAEIAHCKRGTRDASSLKTSPEDHQSPALDPQGLSTVKDRECEGQNACSGSNCSPSTVNQHIKTSVHMDPENLPSTSKMEGACSSSSPGVVRFSKDQRPTSLPIQPFVLQLPPGKQQKPLGSLLNQYLGHGKPSSSGGAPHRGKGKGKGKAVPSFLRPSPLGGYSALHLEAASSSDTCSTCTPSPVPFPHPHRLAWGFHHQQQRRHDSPPDAQCHLDSTTQSGSGSNPFRLYVSQSSPDEALDCQSKRSEDAMSPPARTGAKRSPDASNPIRSPRPALTLPAQQHALELSPKMADPFQPLGPASLEAELSQVAEPVPVWDMCHRGPSPAVTSVTCLNTPPCLSSCPVERPMAQCSTSAVLSTTPFCRPALPNRFQGRQPQPYHQQGDSFSLTDRPPEEFCLSPDASSESLSIDLLQKKALLKAVSSAVDLISTYFEHPRRDADEKLQLGNSTLNPNIALLVLNKLCPAIRNILLDGLRSYKLDLIVGQRRNQPWDIVLASTQPGPTTRVLHSLVSVVSKCSQLTKHSMRFNAFIMGLLNLRALEFWLNHLYTCVDVLRPLYHHWGLVPLWQGPCRPHLHELLLLLEPLAALPFDLHLLSEARLLKCTSSLLAQSAYSSLQMSAISANPNKGGEQRKEQLESTERRVKRESSSVYTALPSPQTVMQHISLGPQTNSAQSQSRPLGGSSGQSDSAVGWWLQQPSVVEGVMAPSVDTQENRWSEERREEECGRGMERREETLEERSPQELRWARLFGARVGAPIRRESKQQGPNKTQKNRLPSQWLSLDGSGLELLAQSVWSSRRQETYPFPNHTADMAERNRH